MATEIVIKWPNLTEKNTIIRITQLVIGPKSLPYDSFLTIKLN